MIDFPDVPHTSPPPQPPQLPSTDEQPVSKSDRFAEDFDRSWPRRTGDDGRSKDERVLFNASSNRLESRPEQTRLDPGRSGDRERAWGPKLLGRETGDTGRAAPPEPAASASGLGGRSLPPHLSAAADPSSVGEGPSAGTTGTGTASGSWRSSAPSRPAWGGVVGRHRLQASQEEEEWGWVNRDSHGRVGTMRVNANAQQARGRVYNQDEDRSMPANRLTLYTRIPTPMPHPHPHPQPPLFLPHPQPPLFLPLPQPRPILTHNRSRCILPQRKHV